MPLITPDPDRYIVKYNGYQFNSVTTETLNITSTAHYDEAGRTITYMTHVIRLRTIIYGESTDRLGADGQRLIDDKMQNLRQRLSEPGGTFFYHDRGYGEFSIQAGVRQKTVDWGPKPKVITWVPLGNANAAEVTWEVEVSIPECAAARFDNAIMEWNYQVEYIVGPDGETTRRVSGHLIIPQTRTQQANRHFQRSADEYRDLIQPHTPFGMRPMAKTFALSLDKCRLDFSFVDQEMGNNIPPPGCLRVDANMSARNDSQGGFINYIYTLNATYELARGVSSQVAVAHFRKLRDQRRNVIAKLAAKGDDGKGEPQIIPWFYHVSEPKIYDYVKRCSFSTTFLVTFPSIQTIMTAGFWEPVPDSSWRKWRASLGDVLFNTRGTAGLIFDPVKDDIIVDLCAQNVKKGILQSVQRPTSRPRPPAPTDRERTKPSGWVAFQQSFRLVEVDSTMVHKPLVDDNLSPNDPRRRNIVANRCRSTKWVIHEGSAIRFNAPVAPPRLESIGTFKMIPANRECDGFKQEIKKGEEGRLYIAKWRFRYAPTNDVGTNGPVFNPVWDEGDTYVTFENQAVLVGQRRGPQGARRF